MTTRAGTAHERPRPSAGLARAISLALLVIFSCVFPFVYQLNNPNENVRTYMTMAIVDEHTFRIDTLIERYGWTNDMAKAPDKLGVPHLYSVKAPAVSYLGVPVYAAFRLIAPALGMPQPKPLDDLRAHQNWFRATTWALRFFTIQLPCLAFLLLFERWLRRISRDDVLRWSTVLAAGLGTNYLAYAMLFASHAPFAWASFASFVLVYAPLRATYRGDKLPFLAGLFAGLATLLEYHALPVSAALGLLALARYRRWRPVVAFGAGAATQALLLMFFQWRAYGNPLTPGHKMCENPQFAAVLSQGVFGIGLPDAKVFFDLSVSPGFGFFGLSPFMVLGLVALPFLLTVRRPKPTIGREAVVGAALTMLALWLTVSAAVNWRGGWTIGPRYLGAAPPFFAFLSLLGLEWFAEGSAWRRVVARAAAAGLALASVVSIGLAGFMFSSLPEDVTRPLPEVVVPFLVAGMVPHHVGELLGFTDPRVFYVLVLVLLATPAVLLVVPSRDRGVRYAARVLLGVVFFAIGMGPALSTPRQSEGLTAGGNTRNYYVPIWEPIGHDAWTLLRKRHMLHEATACDYVKLARIEKLFRHDDVSVTYTQEAEKRGGCKNLLQRF